LRPIASLIFYKRGVDILLAACKRARDAQLVVSRSGHCGSRNFKKFQMEQVSDGNASEQNLEVADLRSRA
jgi:hypothetical protein